MVSIISVDCGYCKNRFERSRGRYNEAIKMGWNQFCSLRCQQLFKQDRKTYICKTCKTLVTRSKSKIESSGNIFCSLTCSAIYINQHRVTRLTIARAERKRAKPICANPKCDKQIGIDNKQFCSPKCRYEAMKIYELDHVTKEIKNLFNQLGRLPIKHEVPSLSSQARRTFGSWNKAIEAAGFQPNLVRFSKKYIANDGHPCDSLSEKIIDDWLSARKIKHEVKIKYPWNNGMSVDFKVGEYWIELFGLCGQLKTYDRLMRLKLDQVKKYNLKLISIYLSDLYPVNHLEEKFRVLTKITRNIHNDF